MEPARSPARVANLRQLLDAAPDIFGNIVPILAGFKIATTERLPLPLIAVIPGAAALAAFLWFARRRMTTDFFALFVVFFPLLFLASGAYLDTQSYRYLIPWYAGLAVAWAVGSLALARGRKALATGVVAAIVAVHAWQQVIWYQKLQPDTQSFATVDCLKRHGIRGGFAEYWTAYKLTFVAQEEIIIAPTDGIDRYPRYTEYVRALPRPPSGSMSKMAPAGEDHGDAVFVCGGNDFGIAQRPARLNDGRGAGLRDRVQPVAKRKERIRCRNRSGERIFSL